MTSLDRLYFLNRAWIRALLNAILRPVFCRMREAERAGDSRADLYGRRFYALLNACDCFPFCVEVDPCGLWILDEPSEREDDC